MPRSKLSSPEKNQGPAACGRKVICAFYASITYGSEYRAGLEFIRYAAANGFDTAIVADLEENSSQWTLEAEAPGIHVVCIPSVIKRQKTLYRYSDLFAQIVWHFRTARWLARQRLPIQTLWIQNGALPWLPLRPYFPIAPTIIWGPVGGGEPPTAEMMKRLPLMARVRERLRSTLERTLLNRKFVAARQLGAPRLLVIARTVESQRRLIQGLGRSVPVIPEILDPLESILIHRVVRETPRLIWVGHNIPRKNLKLALDIFRSLRSTYFPNATLDVFGTSSHGDPISSMAGVTFHGWVKQIDWPAFQDDGVLLLTSFREGLPSAVLEAARHGLLCIAADVGAVASLEVSTVHVLPRAEYPCYSDSTLQEISDRIRHHLAQTTISLPPVSYRDKLSKYLQAEGVIS